ncbi:MAG: hypothetical protein AB7Q81_08970 [Gammaproteobacteria bacterium]
MNKIVVFALVLVAAGIFLHDREPAFERPPRLTAERADDDMQKFEFESLRAEGKLFEALAVPGHYTVLEGYTDSCGVCRALERELPAFLARRGDVLVRRVRFDERGGFRVQAATEDEAMAQVRAYADSLARYRAFAVVDGEQGPGVGACGTPHVEIYGPDGNLMVSDHCEGRVFKHGLDFLRRWMAAEQDG